jgi:V/A-type H+/Na+-transporting ATPase subunit D
MSGHGFAVPPGRAGRLWLDRRLTVARRAADLLDRKLRLLQTELARRQDAAALTAAEWDRCRLDAERWLLRAVLLGGQRAIRLGNDGQYADIEVSYVTTMGVRHPGSASCVVPRPVGWDGPVLAAARRAHQDALNAAVHHAVAAEALNLIRAEMLATRYRLHALKDRWIPGLEQAMAEVTLAIEEEELADAARLRLAAPLREAGR